MQIRFSLKLFIFMLFITFGCATAEASSTQTACVDIRKLDVNNMRLSIGEQTFSFQNGEALTWSEINSKKIQGRANIERDNIVDASPNVPVRFLLIHNSYDKGGGWKFYLVGYTCFKGSLKQVFERDASSLKIDRLEPRSIVISVVPIASTSVRKHFTYRWNDKYQKYIAEPDKLFKK